MVVVPNTTLMDNHQLDLARALHEAGNVCVHDPGWRRARCCTSRRRVGPVSHARLSFRALCAPSELAATLKSVDVGALKRVPAANSAGFRRCIDACCGVTKQD